MTFLPTCGVDLGICLLEQFVPLSRASNDLMVVNCAANTVWLLREIRRSITCTVRDASVDSFADVLVSIFEEGNTDKQMRWDIFVQPIDDLGDELIPVSVIPLQDLEAWSSVCIVSLCEPYELVVGAANVLGCLDERNDIDAFLLGHCIFVDESIPGVRLWEVMELKIVKWWFAVINRVFTVEYGQNVITLFNLSLVHGERQDLISSDLFFLNPFAKFFSVLL